VIVPRAQKVLLTTSDPQNAQTASYHSTKGQIA